MHKYESLVLKALSKKNNIDLNELASMTGIGRDEVLWALENLKNKRLVNVDYTEREKIIVSDEGKEYARDGLPEEQLVKKLLNKKIDVADLIDQKSRIGLQWAKKESLVQITSTGELKLTKAGEKEAEVGSEEGRLIRLLSEEKYDQEMLEKHKEKLPDLVKRKLIRIERGKSIQNISITQEGIAAPKEASAEMIDNVDRSVIANETWKEKEFKKYDVNVGVERRIPAIRSPIKRIIEQVKDAYASMGFKEISGPAVESSFWNFDSLFVPQDHPAREMQDTFYVSNIDGPGIEDIPYVKRVRKVHEESWHSKWSEDVSRQLVLRTHTTSVTSRYVYSIMSEIAKNKSEYSLPIKLFCVGRVFRNEAIDYKHLADLYQMDGLIIGKDLTLSNLFDTLKKIYDCLGIEIRFKPSYFPFVEPGAEFQARLKGRDEWIEMGGSGLLREEITGVRRSSLSALAWGAGLERILLVKDPSLQGITELYNNDMDWLRKRRLV